MTALGPERATARPISRDFWFVADGGVSTRLLLDVPASAKRKRPTVADFRPRRPEFRGCGSRDAGQSQTARSTRTVRTRNGDGLLQLPLTSVDVLHDLMRDAVGIRDLPTNFDEARTGQHSG
jgi:hypothetical protein